MIVSILYEIYKSDYMPTNLPAEAEAAYQRYLEATSLEEKIRALEDYISKIPKHKGTEKLLKNAKRTLTKLKLELERKRTISKKRASGSPFSVAKEEDIMLSLLGLPSTGKTLLFRYLTDQNHYSELKTTIYPSIGVMNYKGVNIQVVDLPPLFSSNLDETPNGRAIMAVARSSDIIGLVIDLTQDVGWQYEILYNALKNANIVVDRDPPPIRFEKLGKGGIQISGADLTPFSQEELVDLIKSSGVNNCIFDIYGPVDEEDIYNVLNRRTVYKKAIVIGTKGDEKGTKSNVERLKSMQKLPVLPTSAILKIGKDFLGDVILKELKLIRVWTRKKGGVAEKPLVIPYGSTVKDAAGKIHSDFLKKFKYAIVERPKSKISKMRVGLNYKLEDGDILSIYLEE